MHNLVNFIIENDKKIGLQLRIKISARFSVNFQFRAEVKRSQAKLSQAENLLARAMAQAAWLGLITNIYTLQIYLAKALIHSIVI